MSFWDERFSGDGYLYGTEPNDWLGETASRIPRGPVLCLADGEGRNGVYLAGLGHPVTSVDASTVGLAKARRLAADRDVALATVHADLSAYDLGDARWAGVVSIFCHLPSPVRKRVHAGVVRALEPGGVLVLEAFTPDQIGRGTGGPRDPDLLMRAEDLRVELEGLDVEVCRERIRTLHEGPKHVGDAAVVQLLAVRPSADPR